MDEKKLFHGCIGFDENENGLLPLRITGKRLSMYDSDPERPYARAAASVYIDFITDAESISIFYRTEKMYFTPVSFDIYENDVFSAVISQPLGKFEGEIRYDCSLKGEKRIRIYLPSAAIIRYRDFSLGNWRPVEPSERRLVLYGDSITQGLFGANPSLGVLPQLGRIFDLSYLNLSVGGEQYRKEVIEDEGFHPGYVLIALGTNDWAYRAPSLEALRENISSFYSEIDRVYPDAAKAVVVPISIMCEMSDADRSYFESIRSIVFEESAKRNYLTIDGMKLVPPQRSFYEDDAHPNNSGFQNYAAGLAGELVRNGYFV